MKVLNSVILFSPILASAYPEVYGTKVQRGLVPRQSVNNPDCLVENLALESLGLPLLPCSTTIGVAPATSTPAQFDPSQCIPENPGACNLPPDVERPNCKAPSDCTSYCATQFASDPTAAQYGVALICSDQSCSCSAELAKGFDEAVIGIGEVLCAVVDEAIPLAENLLGYVIPYAGKAAEGASELFSAAGKVLKKGAKNCADVCPGHQYTVVDPTDIGTQLGILDCGLASSS